MCRRWECSPVRVFDNKDGAVRRGRQMSLGHDLPRQRQGGLVSFTRSQQSEAQLSRRKPRSHAWGLVLSIIYSIFWMIRPNTGVFLEGRSTHFYRRVWSLVQMMQSALRLICVSCNCSSGRNLQSSLRSSGTTSNNFWMKMFMVSAEERKQSLQNKWTQEKTPAELKYDVYSLVHWHSRPMTQ